MQYKAFNNIIFIVVLGNKSLNIFKLIHQHRSYFPLTRKRHSLSINYPTT